MDVPSCTHRGSERPFGPSLGLGRSNWAILLLAAAAIVGKLAAGPAAPCLGAEPNATANLTKEMVGQRLKALDDDASVSEEVRSAAREQFAKAQRDLDVAVAERNAYREFQGRIDAVASELKKAELRRHEASMVPEEVTPPKDASLSDLEQELATHEVTLNRRREAVAQADAEPKRRAARIEEIPKLLDAVQVELTQLTQQLAGTPAEALDAASVATRTALEARHMALTSQHDRLEKERECYSATKDLLQVQRDAAAAELAVTEAETRLWRDLVNQVRQEEAQRQAMQASRAARHAELLSSPELVALAQQASELANQRATLADSIANVTQELQNSEAILGRINQDFQRTQEKIAAVGLSDESGQVLRNQRTTLKTTNRYYRNIQRRIAERREARLKEYEYQDMRADLVNLDEVTRQIVEQIAGKSDEETAGAIRRLLTQKKEYLDSLIPDSQSYNELLLRINAVENELVEKTKAYAAFIDERVLWVRSTELLDKSDLQIARDAVHWFTLPSHWEKTWKTLYTDARERPFLVIPFCMVIAALIYAKRPIRRRLRELGEGAKRRGTATFSPTLRTLMLSAIAGILGPLCVCFVGWRLSENGTSNDLHAALGIGLLGVAYAWVPLELLRQVARPFGLADCHFDWPDSVLNNVRWQCRWMILIGLPLLLIVVTLQVQTVEVLYSSSLGRMAFVAFMFGTAVLVTHILLRRFRAPLVSAFPKLAQRRIHLGLLLLSVCVLGALGVLAVLGYYATAQTLAVCVFDSLWLTFALLVLNGMVKRWLLVRRRKLAMDQLRQRRANLEALGMAGGSNTPGISFETGTPDTNDEVDLGAVTLQTKKLIQTMLLVLGLSLGWTIWDNVFPALNILKSIPAVPGLLQITLADVLLAGLIGVVAYVATRNVPGLLELVLLNYLPVDAGARFATTTVCRYLIGLSGIWLFGKTLRIDWQSIQWLVAAMGIGLGFGLQEIFANFVSGLILLFERPIRVGDVVTLGDTTGSVTRIRLRATTITDWDRKEYIVPNRDLITGRLLNWTLSDQTNRIVIKVGIAYGSDTELACRLLRDTALQLPEILKDPPPTATFDGFGDSMLNLTLRCFLPDLEHRLETIHKLHTQIDHVFRQANIEIPFPQREFRVRQIPAA